MILALHPVAAAVGNNAVALSIYHITNYWTIVGFTAVREIEALIKSCACFVLFAIALVHALRKDHCFGKVFVLISLGWLSMCVNSVTVALSLWQSPVPNVARAGVSIAGLFGSLGVWYIAYASYAYFHETAFMLTEWTEINEKRLALKGEETRPAPKKKRRVNAGGEVHGTA